MKIPWNKFCFDIRIHCIKIMKHIYLNVNLYINGMIMLATNMHIVQV